MGAYPASRLAPWFSVPSPAPTDDDEVELNLTEELKKGGHYHDMPQIREQLSQPPRPLLDNMKALPSGKTPAHPGQGAESHRARPCDFTGLHVRIINPKIATEPASSMSIRKYNAVVAVASVAASGCAWPLRFTSGHG